MPLIIEHPLPSPVEIAERYPVTVAHRIDERRQSARNVIAGTDPRLMMIIGPCSAWPSEAVLAYTEKLARLEEEVRDKLLIVLRCYIQKPRTIKGWPGPLNQPDPREPIDIAKGIEQCSKLMHEAGQMLPLADEMLFTHNDDYFDRFLSYTAVGARSAEDQEHRYHASGLSMPVGMKNPTSGDIEIGVNSVMAAQSPHRFTYKGNQVRTTGNEHAHLILRGGGGKPNYDPQSIAFAQKKLLEKKAQNPAMIVDASHDNCFNGHGKDPELQMLVVENVLAGIRMKREEYARVRGFMIESFMKQGKQPENDIRDLNGLSITDPCLGWEETERMLKDTAMAL